MNEISPTHHFIVRGDSTHQTKELDPVTLKIANLAVVIFASLLSFALLPPLGATLISVGLLAIWGVAHGVSILKIFKHLSNIMNTIQLFTWIVTLFKSNPNRGARRTEEGMMDPKFTPYPGASTNVSRRYVAAALHQQTGHQTSRARVGGGHRENSFGRS